jgi:multimeric flavodoxin WrbA
MAELKALFLNCTLKPSPQVSNTEALIGEVIEWFDRLAVESEVVRVVDYHVPFGITSDEGEGDEWPIILEKVKAADILVVGTPIWFGVRGSVAQMVIERLDGTYNERNEFGQYPLYNKVGGVVVTGNEDGAHAAAETTLFNLSHLGCTIPPNADTYWVGEAGPGPSYIEAGGRDHPYTKRTTRWMAHNLVHLARMLKASPIPAEGNTFDEEDDHAPHIG